MVGGECAIQRQIGKTKEIVSESVAHDELSMSNVCLFFCSLNVKAI